MAAACARPSGPPGAHSGPAREGPSTSDKTSTEPGTIHKAFGAYSGGPITSPNAEREVTGCARQVVQNLDPDAWFEAAAKSCHPGGKKSGAAIERTLLPEVPAIFDIPQSDSASCFSAYVIVAESQLPLTVEVIDDQNEPKPIGAVRTIRAAIPELGPLCSLQGHYRKLRVSSESTKAAPITLAFVLGQ